MLTKTRSDAFLPLSKDLVPPPILERLAALGVTTLEELRDLWSYGNRQWLVDYLGDSPLRFIAAPPPAGATRGVAAHGPGGTLNLWAAGRTPPLVRRPRGVVLTAAQRHRKAAAPPPLRPTARRPPAAPAVSLAGRFPPVRDQGQRGTCVAFASVAFLQYHLAAGSPKGQRLSEQFVYWACKELDGIPQEEGTHVRTAREVIEKCGACRATTWKYVPKPVAGNEGQGPPPPGAEAEAKDCRWAKARAASAGKVEHLQQLLKEGKPVVLSVLTFPLWDFPVVEQTGEITLPLPETQPDGAHAVCLVGYELNDRLPGGGAFLFRNSWGRKWAQRGGRFGPGHGTLLFEYVNLYAMEAFA